MDSYSSQIPKTAPLRRLLLRRAVFRAGNLYEYDDRGVTIIRAWPRPAAWRRSNNGHLFSDRPDIGLGLFWVDDQLTEAVRRTADFLPAGVDEAAWWTNLEDSLRLLQVEKIDIYNQHGMSWERFTKAYEPHTYKWVCKAKEQGLIGHICCSFHDNCEALIKLVDTGLFSAITMQYNLVDQSLAPGMAHAHAKDVGVVVMGPIAGGMLGENSEAMRSLLPGAESTAELALRFVLSNPHVSLAISGMNEMEQVVENIAVGADDRILSADEIVALEGRMADLKKMADLYCTQCNYCMPCPADVAIPEIFHSYNRGRVYGLWAAARKDYGQIGSYQGDTRKRVDACADCGECEDKCPQDIPIRKQLAEAHEALTAEN